MRFDVWQLYESGGQTEGMAECFTIYLVSHNRPPHEVLFGSDKDISTEYESAFVGMTEIECSLDTLLDAPADTVVGLKGLFHAAGLLIRHPGRRSPSGQFRLRRKEPVVCLLPLHETKAPYRSWCKDTACQHQQTAAPA